MATDHDDDLDRDDGLTLDEGNNDTLQHDDLGGDGGDDLGGDGAGDQGGGDDTHGDDGDDLVISFGEGDEPSARSEDSAPIRALREENRRQARELAELRKASAPPPVELGPRPTLEACEYDEDRFATETEAWIGRKAKADADTQKQQQQAQAQQQAWQEELDGFARKKQALKVRDFDAAEEEVVANLSQVQQAIIVQAADNSAQVIYALGKHPEKLSELAKITNPVKFTAAIVKLEGSLKVTTRRQAPTPDRPVRGAAPFTASNGKTDAHLEKLERAAEKSGDRTAIVAYKREQREKANKNPRR